MDIPLFIHYFVIRMQLYPTTEFELHLKIDRRRSLGFLRRLFDCPLYVRDAADQSSSLDTPE